MPEEAQRLTSRTTVARNVGVVLLVVVLAVAVIAAPSANWDLALLGVLLGFADFSDLTAKVGRRTGSTSRAASRRWSWRWSSSVGTPAALMGLATAFIG